MFTLLYKGTYIHCYIDRAECRTQCQWNSGLTVHHKSLHAAKCYITKWTPRQEG